VGLLVFLAVLVVAVVATRAGQDDTDTTVPTTVTLPPGPVDDEVLAAALLPAVGALGPEWIETQRDDAAVEAEPSPPGTCPAGPVPEGYLIRGEQRRTQGNDIVETLSVTAGVVAEGVEPPSLDDEFVATCLLDGLRAQLPATSTAEPGPEVALGPPPAGAVVSHVRLVVTGDDGTGGNFDFVLVRRDRLVSLGLVTGVAGAAVDPTPLPAVVAALDDPLQAALPSLG
jgi:hypothetical protein